MYRVFLATIGLNACTRAPRVARPHKTRLGAKSCSREYAVTRVMHVTS